MHTKKWELFEWEEELKVLGLEYFYIGKHFYFIFVNLTFLYPAFIFLGIGSAISMVAFFCEIVCAKSNFANILSHVCGYFKQFNQEQN